MFRFLILFCLLAQNLLSKENWEAFKQQTIAEISNIPGWCTEDKARLMMDLIHKNKFQRCIEIGVFCGSSLFVIAKALQYNQSGLVYGIDTWCAEEALKGMKAEDPNHAWWSSLDFNQLLQSSIDLIARHKLNKHCSIIKMRSSEFAKRISNASIDFIHIDGNHSDESVFDDVVTYFPIVKDKGYILLHDANWVSMRRAVFFLLERATLINEFSPSSNYLLFMKNTKREKGAEILFIN
jgi:hypothetical protein